MKSKNDTFACRGWSWAGGAAGLAENNFMGKKGDPIPGGGEISG